MSDDLHPLTRHGIESGKKRLSLSRDAVARTACKAFADGVRAGETSGRLRRYLDHLGSEYKTTPVVHANHVWAFGANRLLVTVFELPHEFRKSAASALSKRPKGGAA